VGHGRGGFDEPVALTLERVRKAYGGLTAVDDVSLNVRGGEFVTLLGPSGSGKTTTLRIVAGLIRADAGRIVARGRDITGIPAYQRDIGIVFEHVRDGDLQGLVGRARRRATRLLRRGRPPT